MMSSTGWLCLYEMYQRSIIINGLIYNNKDCSEYNIINM